MNKEKKCSLKKGFIDVKAPLATFDTIDLGEDSACIVALCKDTKRFAHQLVLTEARANKDNGSDNCDDLPKVFPLTTKYEKLSSASDCQTEEESDKSESASFSKKDGNESKESSGSFSDSSSSDSEHGFLHGKPLTSSKRITQDYFPLCEQQCSPIIRRNSRFSEHDTSLESTPVSSPLLSRNQLPDLIKQLETVKCESKKKALEKRIQRLQVTTKGIERPRSTTPINVVSLGEYKEISSPEICKNQVECQEKLKIKLPDEHEHSSKHRSPRKAKNAHLHAEHFDFGEDHLFTYTKQALVLQQDDFQRVSPRKVLIPPTLSPPLVSPGKPCFVIPDSPVHKRKETKCLCSDSNIGETIDIWSSKPAKCLLSENWAHFDEDETSSKNSKLITQNSQQCSQEFPVSFEQALYVQSGNPSAIEQFENPEDYEEVLIVNVLEMKDGERQCDIHFDDVAPISIDPKMSKDTIENGNGKFNCIIDISKSNFDESTSNEPNSVLNLNNFDIEPVQNNTGNRLDNEFDELNRNISQHLIGMTSEDNTKNELFSLEVSNETDIASHDFKPETEDSSEEFTSSVDTKETTIY